VRRVVAFGFADAPPAVTDALALGDATDVLASTSVRSVDDAPLDLVQEWVPAPLAGAISRRDAQETGIWATLQRQGHPIDVVRQSVTASVATADDARALGTTEGSALLLVRRIALGADGGPLALSDHRYLAHRFSLEVEFRGWSGGTSDDPPGLRSTPVAATTR
jgi:GntR family transcriptional regulator